jgi:hypothetical protein
MADAQSWLPTLDKARAQGLPLPDGEPEAVHKHAALIVVARAVRRDTWDELMDGEQAASIGVRAAPAPPTGYDVSSCTWVVEPSQGGRARVRHVHDKPLFMCELYTPTLPILNPFEAALEKLSELGKPPPEELRCPDLRPRNVGGSAYRGGGALQAPDFHGYEFLDAIEKGATAVDRLGVRGSIFLLQVLAYAWPFLWVRYRHAGHEHEVMISACRTGALQMVVAAPAS